MTAKKLKAKAEKETKALAPVQEAIVMPAVSTKEAVEAWQQYQDLKAKIKEPSDVQEIQGNEFLKKSYWRKIAAFFNLTIEVVSEEKEKLGSTFVWHFTIKAIAPNGRSAIGTGSCDMYEKAEFDPETKQYMATNRKTGQKFPAKPNSIHNIRTTAETRAFNRAVSNLVGGGEVSAEEVNGK